MAVIFNRVFSLSCSFFSCCLLLAALTGCQANGNNSPDVVVDTGDNFSVLKDSLEQNARRQQQMLEQLAHLLSANEEIALNVKAIKIQVEAQQTQLLALSKKLVSLNKVVAPFRSADEKTPGERQLLEQMLLVMDALKISLGQLEAEQAALYQKLYSKPGKLFYLCRPPRCDKDYESDLNFSN
ncbi:hypothetical protein [Thalassomonas haliotis]|uniref:Lipoprotein n=1 Tax=Thalassomonas haliotis TaxID=485448 RepID=A0ABY7VE54_9GAMM|nr:hypothetical protein [Thalassomonas haliotis]WDE11972.1 hypothetical protein H3N35_00315 [Thalassomonas haliotis]